MGEYSELLFRARLKHTIDEETLNTIRYLLNLEDVPINYDWPKHKFFKTTRFRHALIGSSAYHITCRSELQEHIIEVTKYKYYDLFINSSLNNYDEEFETFINWIEPYISGYKGDLLGWILDYNCANPKLIYKK